MNSIELVIVIPCDDLGKRLKSEQIKRFLRKHKNVALVVVGYGKASGFGLVEDLRRCFEQRIYIFQDKKLGDSGAAVRMGVLQAEVLFSVEKIALLEPELSISLDETLRLSTCISSKVHVVLGARVPKIDSSYPEKEPHSVLQAIRAYWLCRKTGLRFFDPSSPCIIIRLPLVKHLFQHPWYRPSVYRMELLFRLSELYGSDSLKYLVREIPVKSWQSPCKPKFPLSSMIKEQFNVRRLSGYYKKVNG